jgi:putative peptidoglycan lipid II flippase
VNKDTSLTDLSTLQTDPKEDQLIEQPGSVLRSAGIVSLAIIVSRISGLVREQVFAAKFGAGALYDSYQVAFTIPNTLRDLFAEGALSAAFVKTFNDYQIKRSQEEAWRLASIVLNALGVVLSLVVILGIIFSRPIVNFIADGFSPEKAELTTTLTQIMFPFILFVAFAALAMGVLNSKGRFGVPASASTAFNVVSIVAGLALSYFLSGRSIGVLDPNAVTGEAEQWALIGMAIGTLIGGAAQFLIQIPSLLRVGFQFRPFLDFSSPGMRQILRLMGPAIIGVSAVQVNVLVNTYYVSSINGGRSWLTYAFRLMQLPIGMFGVAFGTAAVPALSRLAAKGDIPRFRSTLSSSINHVFLLTLPSACGLIILGEPIVRLIYQRNVFTADATRMTALALAAYSIGLTGYAAIKVLAPAFYALNDARTPMIISLCSVLVNAISSYVLLRAFAKIGITDIHPNGFGHVGVALSTSIVALFNFSLLFMTMRRRIQRIEGKAMISSFLRISLASAALSFMCYVSHRWLLILLGSEGLGRGLFVTLVPMLLGGTAFLIAAKLLKVRELDQFILIISRRFSLSSRKA